MAFNFFVVLSVLGRIQTETRPQLISWQLCNCSLQPDDSLVLAEPNGTEEEELPALMEGSPTNSPAPLSRLDPLPAPGPSSDDWAQRQAVLQSIAVAVQGPSKPNDATFFLFLFFSKVVAANMRQPDAVKQLSVKRKC